MRFTDRSYGVLPHYLGPAQGRARLGKINAFLIRVELERRDSTDLAYYVVQLRSCCIRFLVASFMKIYLAGYGDVGMQRVHTIGVACRRLRYYRNAALDRGRGPTDPVKSTTRVART